MMAWVHLGVILALAAHAAAKGVFAHFMLPNSDNFTREDWITDITAAKNAHLDAFAMNTGWGAPNTADMLNLAFSVADELDFKLFLSLDYSGSGHWPKDQVITWLSNYTVLPAYYKHRGQKPLVSTFEGAESGAEWGEIKSKVECVFIPDWTSQGAAKAASSPVIDGLMSWDAWPNGDMPMSSAEDGGYMAVLEGRPYIMPVSPWFYTNLLQWHKNWVWRGDDLWYTRWEEVQEVDPEYVEIITWNDFGESHYIGPMHDHDMSIFYYGGAPFDYSKGMPHDAWRMFLPYVIARFKAEKDADIPIPEEGLTVWYRVTPAAVCDDGDTTGNSVQQGQTTLAPEKVLQDKIFFSALLETHADVTVAVGGVNRTAKWSDVPKGGKGIYHGSIPMGPHLGEVVVTLSRNDAFLAQMYGRNITDECPGNQTNWNAWVGNATALGSHGDAEKDSGGWVVNQSMTMMMMMTLVSVLVMAMMEL